VKYVATVGLGIHVQLKTASKLFCACPTQVADQPNAHVCPVCLGYPGVLPRLNRLAVEQGVRVVQALGMEVAGELRLDRKHYVYPDLAKSFQTTQVCAPLGRGGEVEVEVRGKRVSCRLREAHLEEDAATLDHTAYESKLDFNRAGAPLLEIVTEPDLHIGEEAEALLRHLQLLLRTIGASEANPELGQLRCDVSISVAREGGPPGTRVEIKNLSSPRLVRLAIDAELEHQVGLLDQGKRVQQETRGWNENRGLTEGMRSKETAPDYRYLSEPDLPVVMLKRADLDRIAQSVAELPDARAARFGREFGLTRIVARELVSEPAAADYFESCARLVGDGGLAASWTLNQVREIEKRHDHPFSPPVVPSERLAELLGLVREERVSTGNARKLLEMLAAKPEDPRTLLERHGLEQVSDAAAIRAWVQTTIAEQPEVVADLRRGENQSFQLLVGQVIRSSQGRANPRIVSEEIQAALGLRRIAVVDMGGAITAVRGTDGALAPASPATLETLLDSVRGSRQEVRIEQVEVTCELSENLTPREWFELWTTLRGIVRGDAHHGVLVTHGLDTLSYSASLMHWLLPSVRMPVVFTGATKGPEDPESDARAYLAAGVDFASGGAPPGFWVCLGGTALPALNLRMVGVGQPIFASFNLNAPGGPRRQRLATGDWAEVEPDLEALETAVSRTLLVKVYPGLEPGWITAAVKGGVRFVLVELFDTGTGNARRGVRHSLLPMVREVTRSGGAVFCTSQLAVPVNMAEFETSQDLWRAGVVPLGRLVTESAFTKLIAAQLMAADRDSVVRLMASQELSL